MLLTLLPVSMLFMVGCSTSNNSELGSTVKSSRLSGTIIVSAAASLTEVFTQLGKDFQAAHPDTTVTFNFDSSSALAAQIVDGAPADLYASADEANMSKLTDNHLVLDKPRAFARNTLVIITKPGNPRKIKGPADLRDIGVVSLCGEGVPCGIFAGQVLDRAGVTIPESSISRGQNAKATLTAVAEGDAIAGIVYATDADAAGDAIDAITIPNADNVIATYPIVVLSGTDDGETDETDETASDKAKVAQAFMAYVLSDVGQTTLKEFGFLPP